LTLVLIIVLWFRDKQNQTIEYLLIKEKII
jgi:hypothetical protein